MLHEVDHYDGGVLTGREVWDDAAATYTAFNSVGAITATRAFTAAETTFYAAQSAGTSAVANQTANATTIQGRAQAALAANTTFLGLAAPTNAQVVAQAQLLTKECNALIKLSLGLLSDTAGT